MTIHSKNRYLSFLPKCLSLWLKMRVTPRELPIDSGEQRICYVLSRRSFSDLMVLDYVCRQQRLPLPYIKATSLLANEGGSFIYLDILDKQRNSVKLLNRLIEQLRAEPAKEIKIVPISVFWGRHPGRQNTSVIRAFFSDAESLNPLRKLFIIMVQGRDLLVNIGKAISLQEFVKEEISSEQLARKLNRVLRVHFRTQRTAALGPQLYRWQQVIDFILSSQKVVEVIELEARKKGVSASRITNLARKNLETITSDISPHFILLFYIFLNKLFRRIFSKIEVSKRFTNLAEAAKTQELIYLPCHRSHLDYLLLSFVLYREGLMVPHFASGDNMNFWVVGTLLRKAGAFFLRRKFRGNRLYTTLFSEYMHYLVSKGYPLCFFLEGGRSRTGFLLEPKTGLLAMIANSYQRDDYRKIALVPVHITYDKTVEAESYVAETQGAEKKSESMFDIIAARKLLKKSLGKAYVTFGQPLAIGDCLNDPDDKPFNIAVNELAHRAMQKIADHTIVTPTALIGIIILAKPQRSIAVPEFTAMYKVLRELAGEITWATNIEFPDLEPSTLLHMLKDLKQVKLFSHRSGDIFYLTDHNDPSLLYSSNTSRALFLIPALIAQFFRSVDSIDRHSLIRTTIEYYRLMRREFFLAWDQDIETIVDRVLQKMIDLRLLIVERRLIKAPTISDDNFILLHNLSCLMTDTFSRYAVLVTLLSDCQAQISRQELTKQYGLLLQRIAILDGRNDYGYRHQQIVSSQIDNFHKMSLIYDNGQHNKLQIAPHLQKMAETSANFLAKDVRQSIRQIADSL